MNDEFLQMCYECGVADALYPKQSKQGYAINNTPPAWMSPFEASLWLEAYKKTQELF